MPVSASDVDATTAADEPTSQQQRTKLTASSNRWGEKIVYVLLFLCGALSILTTVGIVVVLFVDAAAFFREPNVTVWSFLTGTQWAPNRPPDSEFFSAGVLPLVNGTLLITAIAVVVSVPLGFASAIYLSEYAPQRVRRVLKPTLEVLAGVPTVVLGYFALTFMTPLLRGIFGTGTVGIFNAASAGLVMGIMIVPTVASLSEDALSAVPDKLRMAAYGLGASKRHVIMKSVVPAALSGIVAAVILAFGRAIGETMIVAIAAGNNPALTFNPFEGVQTMTAYIVQTVGGEAPRGSVAYESIFAVGALLFVFTFTLNLLAHWFVRRYREAY